MPFHYGPVRRFRRFKRALGNPDNGVKVIRHYDEFVEPNMVEVIRGSEPAVLDDSGKSLVIEQRFPIETTRSDKVRSVRRIVPGLQARQATPFSAASRTA